MSLRNTYTSFGSVAKSFHWIMVLVFTGLYIVGFYMTGLPLGPEMFEKYAMHKSFGIVALIFAVLRLIWRFTNPVPELPRGMKLYERIGSHLSHIALYAIMLIMPLSGWAMSSAANFPVSFFGLFDLPMIIQPSKAAVENLKFFHGTLAYVTLGVVFVHVAAALKHHFVEKDNVLSRMLPFHKGD